jgi:hypothetical protein
MKSGRPPVEILEEMQKVLRLTMDAVKKGNRWEAERLLRVTGILMDEALRQARGEGQGERNEITRSKL